MEAVIRERGQAGIETIPLSVAHSKFQVGDHLFIDARPVGEFSKGHIPRAASLPFEEMEEHFQTLEKVLDADMPLIVYCRNRECDDALLLGIELSEKVPADEY